jgi:hypothetical protein
MSATHCLIVYSSPVEGREAEYVKWYAEQHLVDVLRVPGFISGQHFKLPGEPGKAPRYVALYEMQSEDPDGALAELTLRAGTPDMIITDAMDLDGVSLTVVKASSSRVIA